MGVCVENSIYSNKEKMSNKIDFIKNFTFGFDSKGIFYNCLTNTTSKIDFTIKENDTIEFILVSEKKFKVNKILYFRRNFDRYYKNMINDLKFDVPFVPFVALESHGDSIEFC